MMGGCISQAGTIYLDMSLQRLGLPPAVETSPASLTRVWTEIALGIGLKQLS